MIKSQKWYSLKVILCLVVLLFGTIFCFANFDVKNANSAVMAEDNTLYTNWYNSLDDIVGGSIIITNFDSTKKLSIAKAINVFTGWGLNSTLNLLDTLPLTIELDGHDQTSINTLLQKLNNYGVSYTSGGIKLQSIIFSNQVSPSTDGLQVGDHLYGFLNEEQTILTIYAEDGGTIYAPQDCSRLFASMDSLTSIVFNNFNTSKVTNMSEMFSNCSSLSQANISNFNFSQVTNMSSMFNNCSSLTEVSFLSIANSLNNLSSMFLGCENLVSVYVNNFNTAAVTNFSNMFNGCENLVELDISNWSFSSLTNISNFLQGCENLSIIEINVTTLGSHKITLPKVFAVGSELVDEISSGDAVYGNVYYTIISLPSTWINSITSKIGGFNPSEINFISSNEEITNDNKIVDGIGFNYNQEEKILNVFSSSVIVSPESMLNFIPKNMIWLSQVNFDNFKLNDTVTSLSSLFERDTMSNQKAIPLVVTFGDKFDTKKVTDMSKMFYMVHRLTNINFGANFTTANVKDMSYMFYDNRRLEELDVSNFNTSNVENMEYMFHNCLKLEQLDVSNFNTSKVTNMQSMFGGCNELLSLDVSGFNTSKVTNMYYMFGDCRKLTQLDVSGFNTANVENMSSMFTGDELIEYLDVTGFNTAKVTNMCCMFNYDLALKNLDVSGFNTAKVTDLSYMFSDCKCLAEIDTSNFDTSKAEDICGMFCGCELLTNIDITSFDLSSCVYMSELFAYNPNLLTVNMSGIDTSNVENFDYMFCDCYRLTTIIGIEDLDTSKGIYFYGMFDDIYSLKSLNLSKWDMKNAEHISYMFEMEESEDYDGELLFEYLDISGWELTSLDLQCGTIDVFLNCNSLKTIVLPYYLCDKNIALPGDFYAVDLVNIEQETDDIYNKLVESEYNRTILQRCGTIYCELMPDAGVYLDGGFGIQVLNTALICVVLVSLIFVCTNKKRRYR